MNIEVGIRKDLSHVLYYVFEKVAQWDENRVHSLFVEARVFELEEVHEYYLLWWWPTQAHNSSDAIQTGRNISAILPSPEKNADSGIAHQRQMTTILLLVQRDGSNSYLLKT